MRLPTDDNPTHLRAAPSTARRRPARRPLRAKGFTLVEILVVVSILALLALLVITSLRWAIGLAGENAMISSVATIQRSAEAYRVRTGHYPGETEPGELLTDWEELDRKIWGKPTPIGGRWYSLGVDEDGDYGVGVRFDAPLIDEESEVLRRQELQSIIGIDDRLDDGDLDTGRVQLQGGQSLVFYQGTN